MVFFQITVDSTDPPALARFWAEALGYSPTPPAQPDTPWNRHYRDRLGEGEAFDNRLFDPDGLRPPIWFQQVPEDKAGKNRVHLDLRMADKEAAVARLTGLGATRLYEANQGPHTWVTMADPEGNEFCIN